MKLELRITHLQSSAPLEAHIVRKLEFLLQRFADRVERVVVRLVDENGPKGGIDKRVRIAVRLAGDMPAVLVEATSDDAYVAVTRATARLHEQIVRVIEKHGWAKAARLEQRRRAPFEVFVPEPNEPA
jgi:ribosome-associated translation inhibitor RaiA